MRAAPLLLLSLALCATALVPPGATAPEDGRNVTCRLDGEAGGGQASASATCLRLDSQGEGEFDVHLVVTLQVQDAGGWTDLETVECDGTSVNGIAQVPCATGANDMEGTQRGLIDLDSPKDWAPAVAEPTYQGGDPVRDPLARDNCDVNELVDSDLTAPDAPWADLCAVTMEHALDQEDGELVSATVIVHVAGLVDQRGPSTTWETRLHTADCGHTLRVEDAGPRDDGPVVSIATGCHSQGTPGCGVVGETIADLLGGSCSSGPVQWEENERTQLDASSVEFRADQIRVTFTRSELGPLAATDLVAGRTIEAVDAYSLTGVRDRETGLTLTFDIDHAWPTGRTYTLD